LRLSLLAFFLKKKVYKKTVLLLLYFLFGFVIEIQKADFGANWSTSTLVQALSD